MAEILNTDITTGVIDGDGIFDKFMSSIETRLDREYAKNRIKGVEYSKVYLGAMESAMQQSIAFELGRQQADKQAELLAQQTLKAVEETALIVSQELKVDAETALINENTTNAVKQGVILDLEDDKVIAETALIDQNIINAVSQNKVIELQDDKIVLENALLGAQKLKVDAEKILVTEQKYKTTSEIVLVKNQGYAELAKVADSVTFDGDALPTVVSGLIGKQSSKILSEKELVNQKRTTEYAQVYDVVYDTVDPVTGVIGKQKALYGKQTDGFDRDAEQKLAKIMVDSWNVRRSTDEATIPAGGMTDPDIKDVLNVAKVGINAPIAKDPPVV